MKLLDTFVHVDCNGSPDKVKWTNCLSWFEWNRLISASAEDTCSWAEFLETCTCGSREINIKRTGLWVYSV